MRLSDEFEWQGRRIAYGRAGSGPDLVFCHGTPWSSVVWDRYAEALTADYTVHLWDLPGYGRSSKEPDHAVDFAAQAQAFAALLEHWGLDRPLVIAHDFGGAVSLGATLFEQARYAALLLVDVVAIPPSGSPFFKFVQDHPTVLDQLPAYIHQAILDAYIRGASHRGLRQEDLAALVEPWTTEEGQPAFYRQIAQYDESYLAKIEDRLPGLDLPIDVIWGAEDAWIPTDHRPPAGRADQVLLHRGAGAGHLIQYDAPVELSNLIRDWLVQHQGLFVP